MDLRPQKRKIDYGPSTGAKRPRNQTRFVKAVAQDGRSTDRKGKGKEVEVTLPLRKEVRDFFDFQRGATKAQTLFLLAFHNIKARESDNPKSYYRIAGIHGWPLRPWPSTDKSKEPHHIWCHHGRTTFPTWHRPYMQVLEQEIQAEAKALAKSWGNEWIEAAETVAFPYWDWAKNATVPDIFTERTLKIVNPPSGAYENPFPNPLRSYAFDANRIEIEELMRAYEQAFEAAKRKAEKKGLPFPTKTADDTPFEKLQALLKLEETIRYADDESGEKFRTEFPSSSFALCRDKTRHLLLSDDDPAIRDWKNFSTRKSKEVTDNKDSIEYVHDEVHLAVGDHFGGHMSTNELSSFDPIFFFHHSNIDRSVFEVS
ncbi:hypothetical protein HDV00_004522 [Rhizophlyctis rosea]|nr:hypothetical protein HDV00_004522 [Rhizophlyctis rosea]